jgi:hypothetical protein
MPPVTPEPEGTPTRDGSRVVPRESQTPDRGESPAKAEAPADKHEELDSELLWLIERIDTMRVGTEGRASMALSAAALLLGGITFILGSSLLANNGPSFNIVSTILLTAALCGALVSVLISVIMSTTSIVNVTTTSRRIVGNRIPSRIFIHPWDTAFVYNDFEAFRKGYITTSRGQLRTALLAYLWTSHHLYRKRYLTTRWAIRALLLSVFFFVVAVAVVLVNVVTRSCC